MCPPQKTETQQGECRGGGEKRGYAGLHTTQCLNSTGSACPVALGHRGCIRAGDAQSTSLGSPGQVLPLYQRKIYLKKIGPEFVEKIEAESRSRRKIEAIGGREQRDNKRAGSWQRKDKNSFRTTLPSGQSGERARPAMQD